MCTIYTKKSCHNTQNITIALSLLDQVSGPFGIVQEVNSYHFITICNICPHHYRLLLRDILCKTFLAFGSITFPIRLYHIRLLCLVFSFHCRLL